MASKYHLLYLLLQPLITPLSAQMVNRPLTTLTDLPATGSASTTLHTSTTTNATLALQPSTTSTSSSTENYYVGPSAVRFTSAAPLNSPPVDPSCCTTTQPSALGDSGGATRTCSGTVDPLAIYVTSTIVVGETITLSDSLITPTPIYITPLPLCSPSVRSSTFSNGGGPGGDTGPVTGGLPTGPVDVASRSSTILVTKKTPVIILQTPSPTQDFGGLAKTYHLDPVSATSTPGMPPPSPDPESPPTASSVLAAIVQSIFAGLPASPTPIPAPSSGQSPPGSAAGQPDTSPQQPDTSPQQSDTTPTNQPSIPPTSIVVNNIPLAVAPSAIVIGTQTFTPPSAPTAVIISGQTFTLSPSQ
ncbi:mucin 5B, oligomeric mucus gel-forming, partial [Xylographa parallela]|nr:mucin 5B, oligomeric mucus gel-forming [Xylographa parallela]